MKRRHTSLALKFLIAFVITGDCVWAATPSNPFHWTVIPSVTVISAPGDPRLGAVREAVAFWNRTFAELGTPFRLGPIAVVAGSVPDEDIQALGNQIMQNSPQGSAPESLERFPGNILIVLSDANFVSYTAYRGGRAIIAIKSGRAPPLTLPNVVPNVIAHELGHALGLEHNNDPTLLMCGRPAACRPDAFEAASPRIFPLSDEERTRLLMLYPASWTARQRT
jgi:hypothetical protein